MSDSTTSTTDHLTFEDAMDRLETIVAAMENRTLHLEDLLTAYDEGWQMIKVCRARIESARQRIEIMSARHRAEAAAVLAPFDPAAAAADPAPEDTTRRPADRSPSARRSTTSGKTSSTDDEDIRLF